MCLHYISVHYLHHSPSLVSAPLCPRGDCVAPASRLAPASAVLATRARHRLRQKLWASQEGNNLHDAIHERRFFYSIRELILLFVPLRKRFEVFQDNLNLVNGFSQKDITEWKKILVITLCVSKLVNILLLQIWLYPILCLAHK